MSPTSKLACLKSDVDIIIDDSFVASIKPDHTHFFQKVIKMIETMANLDDSDNELYDNLNGIVNEESPKKV